jgi:putative ABC transport system permease protein
VGSQSSPELTATVERNVNSVANTVYAVIGVAGLIGLLGLANTLTMSILTRYREIGLLLAVGGTRRRVARMVMVEASTLLLTGLMLSLPLGWLLAQLMVDAADTAVGGHHPLSYPWMSIAVVALITIGAGLASALLPVRRAVRYQPALALRVD